ncbi:sensor histidine kinase [Paenibacillus sp. GCM10023252]|uniref:cache domain-containing sensor histidine kinase n=1 Tax=Paenibacillus sp. GCM10023252 TaxID=3252649 RepID=UPI00362040BA
MKHQARRISEWFRNQRIRSKMMLVYLPLLLLPLFVLGFTANTIYSNAIVKKTTESFTDNSALIINRLDGMLTNTASSANMLALNLNRILGLPKESDNKNTFDLPRYNAITTQLSLALVVFPDVESIVFVDHVGRMYGSDPQLEREPERAMNSHAYKTIMETNGINKWLPMERRDYLTMNGEQPVLTLGKHLYDIKTGTHLGLLFLNVREDRLSSVLEAMKSEPSAEAFIADGGGQVVSSPSKEELLLPIATASTQSWVNAHNRASAIRSIEGERMLLAVRSFPQLGWKLVSVTPLRALTTGLEGLQWTLIAIAAICSLAATFAATFLSKRIASPIVELARSMKGFEEGDLDSQLKVGARDEMGYLALGFNEMLRRLRELLDNVKLEQRKKREYELALIQSQIKPHFLYNTLDVIYALSTMGRAADVQRTTKALADFYRVSLSSGRENITLEEEVRNVRDYLAIQHIRYADVFTYELDLPKSIMKTSIVKLTLQPLVENAIYHGLKEQPRMGHLLLRGYQEGNRIVLEVIDDGVGIPPLKLASLLEQPGAEAAADSRSSYGLRNVNDRLKLTYGNGYGLVIRSELGEGTVVTVTLPAQPSQEEEETNA